MSTLPPIPKPLSPSYLTECENFINVAKKRADSARIQLALAKKSKDDWEKKCKAANINPAKLKEAADVAAKAVTKTEGKLNESINAFFEAANAID